ncbi:hypothetical protein GCM10011515_00940 [Tsuneonella deserti]|uniref:SIR2-like domain-containing protein n=1 Tax=Tsuneonella deserti TaxID=2035528 RepID=A0ABQ1RZ09_9SPHN|nr:hypothetical protein [Tsuneonella deserti]GGD85044.1 hypothetical protein GCM10011515_00940 [Tsuneonella deserti]
MSQTETVFIVGAGASFDFGFPVGKKLQIEIGDLIRPSRSHTDGLHPLIMFNLEGLRSRGIQYGDPLFRHCEWMAETIPLSPSIDTFLDRNSEHGDATSFLGKLAISHIIASREATSSLSQNAKKTVDWKSLSDTWIGRIWALGNVGGATKKVDNPLPKTSFVTFNYDRCIEQFLTLAISQSYRINYRDAALIASNVPCEHVYGSIGSLTSADAFCGYGSAPFPASAGVLADRIKTFTEQVDSATSHRIYSLLQAATRIVFVGFSFGAINLRFLEQAQEPEGAIKQIFGTSYQMSREDSGRAENWADYTFRRGHSGSVFQDLKAAEFFDRNYMIFQ